MCANETSPIPESLTAFRNSTGELYFPTPEYLPSIKFVSNVPIAKSEFFTNFEIPVNIWEKSYPSSIFASSIISIWHNISPTAEILAVLVITVVSPLFDGFVRLFSIAVKISPVCFSSSSACFANNFLSWYFRIWITPSATIMTASKIDTIIIKFLFVIVSSTTFLFLVFLLFRIIFLLQLLMVEICIYYIQKTAYKGTDLILFSNPKFFSEILTA